jgi:hypothetical protein
VGTCVGACVAACLRVGLRACLCVCMYVCIVFHGERLYTMNSAASPVHGCGDLYTVHAY